MDDGLQVWDDYIRAFDYFTPIKIRPGCEPRYREHGPSHPGIVLVHGLSDSPHFMRAIARHFHEELGFNVYLPLLHCHGLKEPRGMEDADAEEWKANVLWAVNHASERSEGVSVGGLSTGGTLSFLAACVAPKVTDDLYLFSAALDLIIDKSGLKGDIAERLLRSSTITWILDRRDSDKPLIGENPYRYMYVDKDGARELAGLIKEVDRILAGFDERHPFKKRVFVAHSRADATANIDGVERDLRRKTAEGCFEAFIIDADKKVGHASLVLEDDIIVDGTVLEKHNPLFGEMMQAVSAFARVG